MARADLERLWNDPAHWSLFGYRCPQDPRVIVPKRVRALGWTINWAHPKAVQMLLLMMGIAAGPALVVIAIMVVAASSVGLSPIGSLVGSLSVLGATALSLVAIVVLASRLARGDG